MRYALTYLFPPLAVLSCGDIPGAIMNLLFVLWPWTSARKHALMVVENYYNDRRFSMLTGSGIAPPRRGLNPRSGGRQLRSAPQQQSYDAPDIGQGGTRFRRR
jgi:uncharacterized membrane protein YqaE (UPF0057 family)